MAASRVACQSFDIGTNTVITITRDKSSYTHTITFKFGSYTGTIATKTTQTSIVWSPAAASLYAQIPNSASGYGEITCQTYDGNTLIGTTKASFYAYAVAEECIPNVTATVEDTNASTIAVTGDKKDLVCYISKPKVTVNAGPKNSATIKSIQIANPVGLYADESPYTFDTVYSKDFRITVIDSRGFKREELVQADNFIIYDPAHVYFAEIKRPETTSTNATATVRGYCFKGSFGAAANTLTLKYRYKTAEGYFTNWTTYTNVTWNTDGEFSAAIPLTGLALEETYIFEFHVQDKLTVFQSDQYILDRGIGDLRLGKDYARFKNKVEIGSLYEDYYKPFRSMRSAGGKGFYAETGASYIPGSGVRSFVLQLYEGVTRDSTKDKRLARYDIRDDGYMYNHVRNMGVAEMMSMTPDMTTSGNRGYMLLNAGSSVPILVQWGRINKVPTGANVVTEQAINFLLPFNSVPAMYTVGVHNLTTTLEAFNGTPTKTGATLFFKRGNGSNTGMYWLAIGDGTAAMP